MTNHTALIAELLEHAGREDQRLNQACADVLRRAAEALNGEAHQNDGNILPDFYSPHAQSPTLKVGDKVWDSTRQCWWIITSQHRSR